MSNSFPTVYPLPNRPPHDHGAAIQTFKRLYLYAREEGDQALATFAIYKALQKLEQVAASGAGTDDERAQEISEASVIVPGWVREGLWNCLTTYILHPENVPGLTATKRPASFLESLRHSWSRYSQWLRLHNELQIRPSSIAKAVSNLVRGNGKGMKDAYKYVERLLGSANSRRFEEGGVALPQVYPRDLVPTGHLLKVFRSLDARREAKAHSMANSRRDRLNDIH